MVLNGDVLNDLSVIMDHVYETFLFEVSNDSKDIKQQFIEVLRNNDVTVIDLKYNNKLIGSATIRLWRKLLCGPLADEFPEIIVYCNRKYQNDE